MQNAILIHGTCSEEEYFSDKYPSLSNSHWFPWLQKQLLIKGIHTQTPEMPDAYKPDYIKWKSEFEKYDVNEDSILVGHSCGGGFLLKWLSENNVSVNTVILVAPWLDPDRVKTTNFFDFEIDPNILNRVKRFTIFVSEDDEPDIHKSVEIIKESIEGVKVIQFKDMGHFTYGEMKRYDFNELFEEILRT